MLASSFFLLALLHPQVSKASPVQFSGGSLSNFVKFVRSITRDPIVVIPNLVSLGESQKVPSFSVSLSRGSASVTLARLAGFTNPTKGYFAFSNARWPVGILSPPQNQQNTEINKARTASSSLKNTRQLYAKDGLVWTLGISPVPTSLVTFARDLLRQPLHFSPFFGSIPLLIDVRPARECIFVHAIAQAIGADVTENKSGYHLVFNSADFRKRAMKTCDFLIAHFEDQDQRAVREMFNQNPEQIEFAKQAYMVATNDLLAQVYSKSESGDISINAKLIPTASSLVKTCLDLDYQATVNLDKGTRSKHYKALSKTLSVLDTNHPTIVFSRFHLPWLTFPYSDDESKLYPGHF